MAGYQSFLAVWLGGGGVPGVILPPVVQPPGVGVHLPDWGHMMLLAELRDIPSAGGHVVPEPPSGPVRVDWGQIILNRRMGR